jgi:hypothetical protein
MSQEALLITGSAYNKEGQPGVLRRILDWWDIGGHKGPFRVDSIMNLIRQTFSTFGGSGRAPGPEETNLITSHGQDD